jgi:hypothetical protein
VYKTICVYSSSSDAIAPEFFAVAEELGAAHEPHPGARHAQHKQESSQR